MTHQPIFRPEALSARERRSAPGDVLRVAPGWTTWGFYALLVLVSTAVIAAAVVKVDRYARGPTAVGDEGRVVVLLPTALAPNIVEGSKVDLDQGPAHVVGTSDAVLSPAQVRQRYGVDVTAPSVAVETSATSAEPGSVARVLVRSDSLIMQFVPGLRSLLGGHGA